jgi:uncharacterized protein with HEPN domain
MTNEAKKRLLDVVSACEAIAEFVAGIDFATYESDRLVRSAVERQFEIIGEALNKAGAAETALAAQIPEFHRIIGLRNRLIHGYDNVDDEILWDIVQSKLAPLKARIDDILREAEKTDR